MSYLYDRVDSMGHFQSMFENMGRGYQFTHAGFEALFEHLQDLAEDGSEPIHIDPIGLCCDYQEFTEGELLDEYRESFIEVLEESGELPMGTSESPELMELPLVDEAFENHVTPELVQEVLDINNKCYIQTKGNTWLLY